MKQVKSVILGYCFLSLLLSCNAQPGNNNHPDSETSDKVNVYYFHFTRRCVTCITVEEQSKLAVEQLYPVQIKNGQVSFTSLNMDEESSKSTAERLHVSGQALLIVKGDKILDLTSQGFLYARSNPDKLKESIKEAVDKL